MEDTRNFTVEELTLLPFLPESSAEHWILATDNEEVSRCKLKLLISSLDRIYFKFLKLQISLILGEIYDLYASSDLPDKSNLPKQRILNIVKQVVRNLRCDDNSVRLNGLKLLRLLAENHYDVFRENFGTLSIKIQVRSPLITDNIIMRHY